MSYSHLFEDKNFAAAVKQVSEEERISVRELEEKINSGRVVLFRNKRHLKAKLVAVGEGLRTKVNANLGTSPEKVDLEMELEKVRTAIANGADTIMDLSIGGNLREIRRRIMEVSTVPVGSVPIYEAACDMAKRKKHIVEMTPDDIFDAIRRHLEDGIDYITVHCGVTLSAVERMEKEGRLVGVVSRGGSFLVKWMQHHGRENPLYEHYDRLLEMAGEFNVTLSLGDGMRPGSLKDATDRTQIEEVITLGELVDRARKTGVQVMVEGPGHIPLHEVAINVELEKKLCHGAPFYVLGPLVTDFAPGYDHITSAIGGAMAAAAGADFLCYVTPSEHLRLPNVDDVREGVIAARIAAHAGDIAKGIPGAREVDDRLSEARKRFDWKEHIALSIDPKRAQELHDQGGTTPDQQMCTMCGEYCAMRD